MRGSVRAVALALAIGGATAAPAQAEQLYAGEGSLSCSIWAFSRQMHLAETPWIEQWVLGYFSGRTEADHNANGSAQALSVGNETVFTMIDTYCSIYPAHKLIDAASSTYRNIDLFISSEGSK